MPTETDLLDADDGVRPVWRMLLDPRGRIGRAEFWRWGIGLPAGIGLLLATLLDIARVPRDVGEFTVNGLLLWPLVAVSAKRWHDRDKSGWWVLVVLIPVVGWAWSLIETGFVRGTVGANRHGADPLQDPWR